MKLLDLWWDAPWFFLALAVVPLLAWRMARLRHVGRVPVPRLDALAAAGQGVVARLWWVPDALRLVALTALILALARPQTEDRQVLSGEGVDIMLALDMSGSMNSVDLPADELDDVLARGERPKNRFEAARQILKRFIASRHGDRIGLVIFGAQAWLKFPLTLDYSRLARTLDELVLDNGYADRSTGRCSNGCTISGAGTAIGDALGRAYNRLRRSKAKTKLVLLITDGKQEGGKLDAAAIARHIRDLPPGERVRVYTFLVGSNDQSWLPQRDFRGRPLRDGAGHYVYTRPRQPFPVDPALLQSVAAMTGGKFYASYNEEKFRQDVADLERTVFKHKVHVSRADVFLPLVLLGLLALALEWALRFTRWRGVA